MTTERIDELIALAALGELTESDELELSAAARVDPAVASELAQALASAAAIQELSAEEPPAGLRDSVLAAVGRTPQESPTAEPSAPPVRLDDVRRRRRWPAITAAVAAAAVLIVGGVVLVSNQASAPDGIAAVVDAPDAQERTLDGELGGTLTVVYSESEGAIVVEGDGLAPLDESQTYQLWLVDDTGAASAGVFRPDADGAVAARFDGVDPTGFVLGVTEEPAGGSDSPTLPILASA
jgi:anti-sigma-K factor RskA